MDIRFRLLLISAMGLLVAAVWLLPYWYPIVNQNTVSDPFPGLPEEAWLSFLNLPTDVQAAFRLLRDGDDDLALTPQPKAALALVEARLLTTPQPAPPEEAVFEPPAGSVVLRRGEFVTLDAIRGASGDLVIYQQPDQTRLLRIENFEMTPAPDVHIIFTRNPDPLDERGVGVDYIDVGALKGAFGNQHYAVPAGVDFGVYPILVLYSVEYELVISTATLR